MGGKIPPRGLPPLFVIRPTGKNRQSKNTRGGFDPAVGDMHRAVGDVQIVVAVDTAVAIHHRCLWIIAHAAGAGLMLAAADSQGGWVAPRLGFARGAQPLAPARGHERGSPPRFRGAW